MLFNPRTIAWITLATLIASADLVSAISPMQLKARHNSLHRRFDAAGSNSNNLEKLAVSIPEEQPVVKPVRKRSTKKCPANKNGSGPVNNAEMSPPPSSSSSSTKSQSRLDIIRSMYAYEGFVYSLESCKGKNDITGDFKSMAAHNARTVMTFGSCPSKDKTSDYENVIEAAQEAGLHIILLVNTLVTGSNTKGDVNNRANNIAQAIINKPDNVLALALGDEPLYDNDFGSPGALAGKIYDLKGKFKNAGLDIPLSISDMAFGWQSAGQTSSSSSVAQALDFFMINTFPYFGQSASWGGDDDAWNSLTKDIQFFEKLANDRPLMITQTGWPSNTAEFAPNSNSIVASVGSSQAFWNLLDDHCSDFFKPKNIGWLWRSWDDTIQGWGVTTSGGKFKFNINGAKRTC